MIRKTIHFTGDVQGVGFRYATTRIARRFDVAGYVQNLPDGKVEVVAEGESDEIERFIGAVRDRLRRHIVEETAADTGATGTFGQPTDPDTFVVRY